MTTTTAKPAASSARSESTTATAWRRFKKHKLAMVSLVVLGVLVALAVFASLVAPYNPAAIDTGNLYATSSATHWFGTDALGRDILSRVLYAGRVSLVVGFAVAILSTLIGVFVGLVAGYFSGQPVTLTAGPASAEFVRLRALEGVWFWPRMLLRWAVWAAIVVFVINTTGQYASTFTGAGVTISWIVGVSLAAVIAFFAFVRFVRVDIDVMLSRLIDVMLSIPSIPILLILAGLIANPQAGIGSWLEGVFGPARSIVLIIVVLTLFNWLAPARLIRAAVLSLRQREFTDAARALGSSDWRIMLRHLLPNTIAPLIVQMTLDVGQAIIGEAALSFLGFGIQEPTASWGNMLTGAQEAIFQQPLIVFWPGAFILATVLSINFIGDGLRDALDPRSRL
jgi:peptide/nickel transport system permease protein